jgi:CheY-like chemotaxis protein
LIVEENRKLEMEPFNEQLESLAGKWSAAPVAPIASNQQAHIALQESERTFRNSLAGALDGTVVVDGQGLVVFANAAAANILGRPQAQLPGTPFAWPITAGQIIEYDVVDSAGKWVIVEVRTVQTVWQGTPACLATLRDITEREQAEARMQRRQAALEKCNRDLQRRNQEVEAIYHTLSHEIKARLTSMREWVSSLDARLANVPLGLDSQPVALGAVAPPDVAPLAEAVQPTLATPAPTAGITGVSLSYDSQLDLPPVSRDQPSILLVLVVDDEADIRDTLRALLEKQGYQVTVAANGVEALELMLDQPPTLVILDLDMPEMDGAETLGFIRKQWNAIPVIIHTGYPEGDLMNRARKVGPFTVLPKPSSPESILAAVRTLTRPNHGTAAESPASRWPESREDFCPKPAPCPTPAGHLNHETNTCR